ncbi:MAG TPA: hypothetical protein VKF32_00165 [Thermoanaerobaculia bacterium]|nr:hypothetical protein [Thermoanaerobaculia bacterium]
MVAARAALSFSAALVLAAAPSAAQAPPGTLVRYSFENGETDTGPDTFRVFANARGKVALSHAFRLSGDTSVELLDAAGDHDFPELLGTFPRIAAGTLYAHFGFLTPTPDQTWNVALAGPERFVNAKDGIAFRLEARGGILRHHSDSIPKKLFALRALTWYVADLVYRVDGGTYDLTIHEEGRREPLVALVRQANASSSPGSSVEVFSFVGDVEEDASAADLFVDDVVIGTYREIALLPFVAPGRRRLFVESLEPARSFLEGRPACLPMGDPEDLGLTPEDVRFGRVGPLERWNEGCAALARGDAERALELFDEAGGPSRSLLAPLSSALALVALGRLDEAEQRLASVRELRDDPRYLRALAALGAARGDLPGAEAWLRAPAADVAEERAVLRCLVAGSREELSEARARGGEAWCRRTEEVMLAEEYFAALLGLRAFGDAARYAERIAARLARAGLPSSEWTERQGDAAFLAGDLVEAKLLYGAARAGGRTTALLRLADVAFASGDLDGERALRESVYGTLTPGR